MALQQHPRAITVGGQTAGADGNVFKIPMPYGVDATITGIAIVYSDGTETQQIGIKRDIEVIQDSLYLNDPKNDKIMNVAIGVIRR